MNEDLSIIDLNFEVRLILHFLVLFSISLNV
jgi:hypothetical protein